MYTTLISLEKSENVMGKILLFEAKDLSGF